jgi:hypothetical protein
MQIAMAKLIAAINKSATTGGSAEGAMPQTKAAAR